MNTLQNRSNDINNYLDHMLKDEDRWERVSRADNLALENHFHSLDRPDDERFEIRSYEERRGI